MPARARSSLDSSTSRVALSADQLRLRSAAARTGIKSTEKLYLCPSPGCSAPTPTTWRAIFSPRSLVMEITTQYSQLSPRSVWRIDPSIRIADTDSACGSAFEELKRRWCWQPGQILALCRTTALQCGQIRVAPKGPARTTLMGTRNLAAAAHQARLDLHFLVFPTEFDVPAHARTRCNGDRSGLDVAHDDAALLNVDALGVFDVALKFAADHDNGGQHLARQMSSRLDAEVAVDAHVALEASRHAHISRTFDFAFDVQIGRNDGFSALR